jgi:hypothetical protein
LGAVKYTEHPTKRCYRTEAQQRPEFLKYKSPADCKVQVSSFTVTVTICPAGHWATASERSSNRRTMLANRSVGTDAVYSATGCTYKRISYSQQLKTLQTYYTALLKATISFAMSANLLVRMEQLCSHQMDFHEISFEYFP